MQNLRWCPRRKRLTATGEAAATAIGSSRWRTVGALGRPDGLAHLRPPSGQTTAGGTAPRRVDWEGDGAVGRISGAVEGRLLNRCRGQHRRLRDGPLCGGTTGANTGTGEAGRRRPHCLRTIQQWGRRARGDHGRRHGRCRGGGGRGQRVAGRVRGGLCAGGGRREGGDVVAVAVHHPGLARGDNLVGGNLTPPTR